MPCEIEDEMSINMMKLPFGYGLMNGLRPKKREQEGCKQEKKFQGNAGKKGL